MRVARQAVLGMAVLGLLVWAAGCGGGKENGKKASASESGKQAGADNSLERVKQAGVLKFGFDPSGGAPFADTDAKTGETVGFEIDMMNAICTHLGVKGERVDNQWDSLIPQMIDRQSTDLVMNGIEINEERKKVVLFSQPYYVYEQQLAVRAEDKDKYKSLEDLKGKKIATLSGAEANAVLEKEGWTEDMLMPLHDSQQPYDVLRDGRVDAVLQENIIAAYYVPKYEGKLHAVEETFAPGKYAVAFRPEDKALAQAVDQVISKMKENGELAAIYEKWNLWNDLQAGVGVKKADTKSAAGQ